MLLPRRRFLAASLVACGAGRVLAGRAATQPPPAPPPNPPPTTPPVPPASGPGQSARPAAAGPAAAEWTGRPPLVTFSGSYSAEKVAGISRHGDQKSWAEVWKRHTGGGAEKDSYGEPVVPEIDFGACMAVSIFQGRAFNSRGLYVVGIEEDDARVLLRYDSRSYQTASFDGRADPGNAVTPYGLFVLPRSGKPLVIEENVQGIIGRPAVWKERARFPGL